MAKKSTDSFTSFRIIGKKAQELLVRAAELRNKQTTDGTEPPAHNGDHTQEELVVRFSMSNIAQAALLLLAIGIGVVLIVVLRDTLIILLLALFLAAIIDPGVRMLERFGFPRGIAVLLQFLIALCIFLFLLISLIPIIASQLQQIAFLINDSVNSFLLNPSIHLPLVTDDINLRLTEFVRVTLVNMSITKFTDALQILGQNMSSIAQGSVLFLSRIAGSVGNFFIQLIVVLVLAFFIQIEKEHIRIWLRSFFAARGRAFLDQKAEAISLKIGQWARGQLILGLAIGSLVFIALSILRIPYAATLAVLAGFTEFIPYIGPFIAAVPAILIALTEGGIFWALLVAGIYYVIQWCENNLLVPLIMKRAVGLSPIAIILAMLMSFSFPDVIHPILGLLLAVPVTTIIAIFLDDWRVRPHS